LPEIAVILRSVSFFKRTIEAFEWQLGNKKLSFHPVSMLEPDSLRLLVVETERICTIIHLNCNYSVAVNNFRFLFFRSLDVFNKIDRNRQLFAAIDERQDFDDVQEHSQVEATSASIHKSFEDLSLADS
jgi:hypothetical protein